MGGGGGACEHISGRLLQRAIDLHLTHVPAFGVSCNEFLAKIIIIYRYDVIVTYL